MKTSSRSTRSQQQGHALPPIAANQSRKKVPKMSTIVQEFINIQPERQRPDNPDLMDMNKKIDVLTNANRKLENSMMAILDEFRVVRQDLELTRCECAALKVENETLRKSVADVFSDMDYLMGKVERIDQKILSKDIEISGVPALQDEDLNDVLHLLFQEVRFESTPSTVTDVYRLKESNKSGLPGPIIVSFNNNSEKAGFLRESKKRQLTSSFLSSNHRQRPVYVNDHMTRLNKYLFFLARNMRRQGHIKYTWFDNGRVLVKVADGSPSIVIECPKTLENLKQQADK
jgi:regulator of replication initiation timing